MNLRRRVARRLGYWADRLAPEDAFRKTSICFEFETGKGIVTNTEGHGCPLWYASQEDYAKAWDRQNAADREKAEGLRNFLQGLTIKPADYQVDAMLAAPLTADKLRAARDARLPDPGIVVHPADAATFEFQAKPVEHCGAVLDNGKLLAAGGTAYMEQVTCAQGPGHLGPHRATVRGFPCRWSAEWVKH